MKKDILKKIVYFCFLLHLSCFTQFKLGIENISFSFLSNLVKKDIINIGLITNQTGVDQNNMRTLDILLQKKCSVKYIFVPEHGLTGIGAERDVPDSKDKKTTIPVISLYSNGTGKMISADYLKDIDVLIFDIQDSGMRHYTYISTLLNTMKIAAENNKTFVVLDRPNPLASLMQGPLVEPDLISFISIASIPLRHAMTIGELAHYFNQHVLERSVKLHVVAMTDYNRNQGFIGPWLQQLSPNIQSLESCIGYSFLGLLGEIEPCDVGIGTSMAFRCIMLPESMSDSSVWKDLSELLRSYEIRSFAYQHIHPRSKKSTQGLRLEFSNINTTRSFELFLDIVECLKKNNIPLTFSQAFNKAVGTHKVQEVIAGKYSKDLLLKEIQQNLQKFQRRAQSSLLYKPFPYV